MDQLPTLGVNKKPFQSCQQDTHLDGIMLGLPRLLSYAGSKNGQFALPSLSNLAAYSRSNQNPPSVYGFDDVFCFHIPMDPSLLVHAIQRSENITQKCKDFRKQAA